MSFDRTEDLQAVRELVRAFAEEEIRPIAAKIDETHEFPMETTKKMAELGLLGVFVPEEWGGAGMDKLVKAGHLGRKSGKGFYEYPDTGRA